MNICVIAGSTRANSSSLNVARFVEQQLGSLATSSVSILDLAAADLPMWQEGIDLDALAATKKQLQQADAFVFIVPEWHGMAPPAVKNLFFLFSGVFRHKPALLVGVSSGTGGRYPIPEMRSTTYKNSFVNYMPLNVVIDRVDKVISPEGTYIAEKAFVLNRMEDGLKTLSVYAEAFSQIRQHEVITPARFGNGV